MRLPPFPGRRMRPETPISGVLASGWAGKRLEAGIPMLGMGKWRNGGEAARGALQPTGNGAGNGAIGGLLANFPRGLPDGNPHRPLATARWASESEILETLGLWKPGRFLIGRDSR